jgi:hypothetical protein
MSEAEHKPSDRSFVATVIIVIGIAWMSLTGLCTAVFAITSLFGGAGLVEGLALTPLFALVGAICILPGFLIWLLGRWLRNRKQKAARSAGDGQ